jgi:hypothetical protein
MSSPVSSLLRGPLVRTPQGWVTVASAIASWFWAAYVVATGASEPIAQEPGRAVTLLIIWPFLVFLFYVRLSMPHFRSSWVQACLLAVSALALPAFVVYRAWS